MQQQLALLIPRPKLQEFPRVEFPAGRLRFPNQTVVDFDLGEMGECLELEDTQVVFTLETLTDITHSVVTGQSYRTSAELVGVYSPSGQRWLFSCFGFSFVKEVEMGDQSLVEMTLPEGTQQIRTQILREDGYSVVHTDLQGNIVD